MRALFAARARALRAHLVLVEPHSLHVEVLMKRSFALNGILPLPPTLRVLEGWFGTRGTGSMRWFNARIDTGRRNTLPVFTLADVLREVSHVDLIDFDAQGGEANLVNSTDDAMALETKVHRIHIETHTHSLSGTLRATLMTHGFEVFDDIPMTSRVMTSMGPVIWRGGRLFAVNKRFVQECADDLV